jgi:hypothetical protein
MLHLGYDNASSFCVFLFVYLFTPEPSHCTATRHTRTKPFSRCDSIATETRMPRIAMTVMIQKNAMTPKRDLASTLTLPTSQDVEEFFNECVTFILYDG